MVFPLQHSKGWDLGWGPQEEEIGPVPSLVAHANRAMKWTWDPMNFKWILRISIFKKWLGARIQSDCSMQRGK